MKSLFRRATFRQDKNVPKFEKNPDAVNSNVNFTMPKIKRRCDRVNSTAAALSPAVGASRSRSFTIKMEGNELDLVDSGACNQVDQDHLLIQINVPEINVKKCLQFPRDQLVWDVKQQCLAALPKELKESFNYGLFCPPENGKAGKFLDEERRLGDYPFNGPKGYLELKYKRRVYKMLSLDEKQLKSLHTRANLRRFLDYVSTGHVEKITKMCSKGLDPNFHCHESGETPLTLATTPKLSPKSSKLLIALVNGGALLDYRSRDGSTAMHRAVDHRNLEAMRTLLQLGASPNYRDGRGLTPLYLSVAQQADAVFAEVLLHDHATVGAADGHGWQEIHQACKSGLTTHLEHLLSYGANMNAQNASGNTPLHVCAVNSQESCARTLLFRGADREALNYTNQTPGQVAVIAGNMELADLIQKYREEEVVPIRRPPIYNPNRRSAIGWLSRAPSIGCLLSPTLSPSESQTSILPHSKSQQQLPSNVTSPVQRTAPSMPKHSTVHIGNPNHMRAAPHVVSSSNHVVLHAPSSPCPSDRSSVPYSSASSSLSDGSSGMIMVNHHGHRLMGMGHNDNTDTASIVTVLALGVQDKSASMLGDTSDIISDSSGVGTANSDTTIGSGSISMPGSTVVCVETYIPEIRDQEAQDGREGHMTIREGDIIEVTGATDDGFLEGTLKSTSSSTRITGLFPASCVQEVRLRYEAASNLVSLAARDRDASTTTLTNTLRRPSEDSTGGGRIHGRRESLGNTNVKFAQGEVDEKVKVHFATAPRSTSKKSPPTCDVPRTVILHRGRKGFGFILRGAKATSTLMELTPSGNCPALQYLDDVDPGGVADIAGLRKGDFLLAINRENVSSASHEHVVELIRRSGELVEMTVVSVNGSTTSQHNSTLPNSKSGILNCSSLDGNQSLPIGRQYATLPRKTGANIGNSSCKTQAPLPPRRDPKTTLSVGRARAKSMVAGLENDRDCPSPVPHSHSTDSLDGVTASQSQQPPPPPHSCSSSSSHSSSHYHTGSSSQQQQQPRTASIRQRPSSGRISTAELDELFQRQRDGSSGGREDKTTTTSGRVYASVAEMKRSKSKAANKIRFGNPFRSAPTTLTDLHRDFHSTPDLAHALAQSSHLPTSLTFSTSIHQHQLQQHRSQEDVNCYGGTNGRGGMLPPPTHPPPPPPISGQVVKVDVGSRVGSESGYDVGQAGKDGSESVVSSFRPTSTAKLYESPGDMKQSHVAYYNRSRSLPSSHATNRVRKAHSMRNPPTVTTATQVQVATSFKVQQQQQQLQTRDGDGVHVIGGSNPYAQPMNRYHGHNNRPSRSHSTVGSSTASTSILTSRCSNTSNTLPRAQTVDVCVGTLSPPSSQPTIPDPDYSCSEAEDEEADLSVTVRKVRHNDINKLTNRLNAVQLQPVENSGNSNTSGSSTGSSSSSMPHSFSVDEIQKTRALLKSSKSFPDNFAAKVQPTRKQQQQQQQALEDADNSSSGVSSDQEVNNGGGGGGVVSEYADRLNNVLMQQHLQHAEGKVYGKGLRSINVVQQAASQRISTCNSNPAVSLIKLPPPQESDADESSVCLPPPPPEFTPSSDNTCSASSIISGEAPLQVGSDEEGVVVLAPPPQFSDTRQTTRVRIVGAVPKTATNSSGRI